MTESATSFIQEASLVSRRREPSRRAALTAYIFVVLAMLVIGRLSSERGDVAVIGNPWAPPGAAARDVALADGEIVGLGRWPFVVLARPNPLNPTGFPTRLRRAGAFLVFNPGFMAGCFAKVF